MSHPALSFVWDTESLERVPAEEIPVESLDKIVPTAAIDAKEEEAYLRRVMKDMGNLDIQNICHYIFRTYGDDFVRIPAGKNIHHSCRYGLLAHTADMLRVAEAFADAHPEQVDRDLLLAGVILHDIGKLREFTYAEVTGIVNGYTAEGNLLGHSVIGALMIEEAAGIVGAAQTVRERLEHIVLAHHGSAAFGAAKEPMTLEAELVHCLDQMTIRLDIYARAAFAAAPGHESCYIPALEKRVYHFAQKATGSDPEACERE